MSASCPDVCDLVIDRLLQLGFELDTDDDDHGDILAALEEVAFVRSPDPDKEVRDGHTVG